jgi:aspartate/methionine/tyrosine aminotransferase
MHPINPNMAATFPPPVMEARRWIAGRDFPADKPLINLSQAAPVDPPPEALARAMAEALITRPSAHLYGPVLGLPELREELAAQWSGFYGGTVRPGQVAITAGCNQAFCAAMSTLAAPGDAVILPLPYYFNHKMWLDMSGIGTQLLSTGDDLLPDPGRAAGLITERTKAIVLVTPNNPAGVEYPPETIRAFLELARARDIALIVDETYRDFLGQEGAPHDLFADPEWDDTLIHLYSFSKAYRLTGHRVGAIMASEARLAEVEKFLDTVAICPPQVGQIGALWGMRNLADWLAGERAEILARRDAVRAGFQRLPGWELLGCGAYFAYARHPFDAPSDVVARRLVEEAHILTLPGTMFGPLRSEGGGGQAEGTLRIAFANADAAGLAEVCDRLAALGA